MEINRNNYEEYFLLYADNELTDSEKTEVLLFLKENKDLEGEFKMILQTISKPDPKITLGNKSFLHKEEFQPFIDEQNYEEIFVLFHDNELNEFQKAATLTFLQEHPDLRGSFNLIGMAKLQSDFSIRFSGKESLYKKEKAGRIVTPIFWSILAAAMVSGFGWWIIAKYTEPSKTPRNRSYAVSQPVKSLPAKPNPGKTSEYSSASPGSGKTKNKIQAVAILQQGNNRHQLPLQKGNKIELAYEKKNIDYPKMKEVNSIPEMMNVTSPVNLSNEADAKIPKDQVAILEPAGSLKKIPRSGLNTSNTTNAVVQPVSYQSEKPGNEDYVFYDVSRDELRKSRVGGFFKKVKRIIDRNNPINKIFESSDNH
jgi:hypothetical protein